MYDVKNKKQASVSRIDIKSMLPDNYKSPSSSLLQNKVLSK